MNYIDKINKFQISIGNIDVIIKCIKKMIVSEEFLPFISNNNNNNNQIYINVCDCNENKILSILNNCLEISKDRSHACYRGGDGYIIVFGPRYVEQKDLKCYSTDLWYLLCSSDFHFCNLYIPNIDTYNEESLSYEFFERPWLQKLIVCKLEINRWMILHGAAVQIDDLGLLILGDSGSGKSTLCQIAQTMNKKVIADDRVLLNTEDNTIRAFGTPWNRKNKHYSINDSFNIDIVLFISHGRTNLLLKNSSLKSSLKLILKQMYLPIHLDRNIKYNIGFDNGAFLLNKLENYCLEFLPNKSVIQYIESYFKGGVHKK